MSMQMMDPHARTLDDALADLKRSLEARPGNIGPSDRPSGGPRLEPRKRLGATPRSSNGVNPGGSNADKAGHYRIVAGGSVPARSAWKIDPLTAVIVVLGVIVGFQQVSARMDRAGDKTTFTKLLYQPAARDKWL